MGETYVHAIAHVGGVPLILPPVLEPTDWASLLPRLDGVLLSGGEDIHPRHYRQARESWLGGTDTERDQSELSLIRQWLELDRPFLGICRGQQLFNVALGGTLYQDIAAHIPHALDHAYSPARPMEKPVHPVTLTPQSRLAEILGTTTLEVNSAHHQAVHTVAPDLRVTAQAPDGVVEALELPTHRFALSVQWHPEAMVKLDDAMWPLFEAFVAAAHG